MSDRWLRWYEGTFSDPKLAEVAEVSGCSRPLAVAVWAAVLEDAAHRRDGGAFEVSARRVAAVLAVPAADVAGALAAIEAIGLTTRGVVTNWRKRQWESDLSTSRVRAFRERKRASGKPQMKQFHSVSQRPQTHIETESPLTPLSDQPSAAALIGGVRPVEGEKPPRPAAVPAPDGAADDPLSGCRPELAELARRAATMPPILSLSPSGGVARIRRGGRRSWDLGEAKAPEAGAAGAQAEVAV